MIEKVAKALEAYLHLVKGKYQEIRMIKKNGVFKLISNKDLEFIELVNYLEKQIIFEQLINETYRFIFGHYFEAKESVLDSFISDLESKITNYFRKSGCYYKIYTNKFVYSDSTLQKYLDALMRKEKKVYYLAPIEYVSFAEQLMEFGQFKIQKFTANELEKFLNNKINKIFYPRTYLKMEQLNKLEEYWFIYFTKEYPVHGYQGYWESESEFYQDVTHMDIEIPKEIENLPIDIWPFIKIMSLFDWQADWLGKSDRARDFIETSTIKFRIPFTIEMDDNLIEPPKNAPDFSILKTEPITNYDHINEDINVYEEPERNIFLNKEQTSYLKEFINENVRVYSSIRIHQNGWQFLDLSLDFFIKGFFANGLDQLLWYVTSIEALLGGKDDGLERQGRNGTLKSEGLTEKLARRTSIILGKAESHRKEIMKTFKELSFLSG